MFKKNFKIVFKKIQNFYKLGNFKTFLPDEQKSSMIAINLFQPNSSLCAALDHMTHTVYGILEGDRIRHYTLPGADLIYPFLVVTGPKEKSNCYY